MTRPKPRYQPGDRIGGRYQVHKALMGGMGEVYLCLDLEENYPYALKTFQSRYQSSALRRAFEQEVATWVALEKHPNIVRCFHMDTLDHQSFMVLEWIAGEEGKGADLRGWLRHGPLDLKTALEITIDVVRGLIHAQQKQPGLVHRDLKPENILVAQGGLAKITDFGLAQIVERAGLEFTPDIANEPSPPTLENRAATVSIVNRQSKIPNPIAGTPAYMAPEQWRGEPLDARTDIYAVGCILYELLTGHWPFWVEVISTTPQQWLSAMQHSHEHEPPPDLPVDLPRTVGQLIRGCMAKARADRPDELVLLLDQLSTLYERQVGQPLPSRPEASDFTAADFNNRAITYYNLKRYYAALADYHRALDLDSNLATAYCNRGNSYQALQNYEAALADYRRAIDLNPNYAMPYCNRGTIYHDLQRYDAALVDYNRAIDLNPDDANAYYNRGNTYHKLKHYEAALIDYNRAIDLDPNLAIAYCNRGTTYDNLQRYNEALADYNHAIDLDPTDASVYLNIGALLGNQGMHQEALPYFEKAAQLGNPKGAQYAAQARQRQGKVDPEPQPDLDLAQAAFNAFQQAVSLEAMRQAVAQYTILKDTQLITAIEQAIAQQVPPDQRPHFEQRLGWLKQIAQEQNP
ncbi:MAG: tetratricopeptide repeat protein [Anaerolineae bacterium]|nr:tetratricopeptide repeat protein [Anaerolineae bacterium]